MCFKDIFQKNHFHVTHHALKEHGERVCICLEDCKSQIHLCYFTLWEKLEIHHAHALRTHTQNPRSWGPVEMRLNKYKCSITILTTLKPVTLRRAHNENQWWCQQQSLTTINRKSIKQTTKQKTEKIIKHKKENREQGGLTFQALQPL